MKLLFCLLLLSFLEFHSSESFFETLDRIKQVYNATPECTFLHTEITSKSIQFFPKCEMVYGILVMNNNTDLNSVQLKNSFRNMKQLFGGLRVENSSLTDLNIFNNLNFSFYCDLYGIFIKNNSMLTDITSLTEFHFFPEIRYKECDFEIHNNTVLDVEDFCDTGNIMKLTYIKNGGNLKDCKCDGSKISVSTLPIYNNCIVIHNGLKIFNTTNTDFSALSNIQTIRGYIDIQGTKIQNLSFLKTWNRWEVRGNYSEIFKLTDNPNLTRLAFSIPERFFADFAVLYGHIDNLHPDFCVTLAELIFFSRDSHLFFTKLQAKICEETGNIGKMILCKFESMYNLPNNCDIILGDVRVEAGDEEEFSKLKEVHYLIGSIVIRNTSLENLRYVGFRYIVTLNNSSPVVQITGNPNLRRVYSYDVWWSFEYTYHISPLYFGAINNIITGGLRSAIIQDNNPDILKSNYCKIHNKNMTLPESFYVDLNYTGADCDGKRVEVIYKGIHRRFHLVLIFLTLNIFLL